MIAGKRIVITGGAGFIGTHIAERLTARNEVALLDIDLDGPLRFSPLAKDSRVLKIEGDVRDEQAVRSAMADADIVLHLASILGVPRVIANARATIDTTVLGTRNVLEAARHGRSLERLVYFSTSEVFGNVTDASEGTSASIGTANDPRLSYAAAKLLGEHMTWAYHRDFGIPTVVVRPFNIYGPRRCAGDAVGLFCVKALAGKDVTLYGNGSQLRSWCYIDDFCDALERCIELPQAIGQDFNIGNPVTATTIYDLAQRIIRLSGSTSRLVAQPCQFTDIGVRAPNSTKVRELLGCEAKVDLESGLAGTIAWYRQHLDEFRQWL
jgi:UDP-glucose 4-epimerase